MQFGACVCDGFPALLDTHPGSLQQGSHVIEGKHGLCNRFGYQIAREKHKDGYRNRFAFRICESANPIFKYKMLENVDLDKLAGS